MSKSEKQLLLYSSLVCIFLGICVQMLSPFIMKWFDLEYPSLRLGSIPIASGWIISLIGIIILIIYKDVIPNIVAAIKGNWKK